MKNINNKALIITLCTVFGVGMMFYLATTVVPHSLVSMVTKASSNGKLSLSNSYFIGENLLAKANGKDKVVVNVFLVDANGKGVSNKKVMLAGMEEGPSLVGTTNELGKATFNITSTKEGQYSLSAVVDSVQIPKKLTVTFRNN